MNKPTQPLDKTFSLYLDGVRFLAAVLVVLAHYLQHRIVQGPIAGYLPAMGREAVIIFFVLSGFVIAYTTEQKNLSPFAYVAARFARVYSVALPVLVLGFAGAALAVGLFDAHIANGHELAKPWLYLPFHLLFAGELWTMSETPPWLAPFWSLGYEVWYYVFFGVVFYLRGKRRLLAAVLVFAILGYKLWLLLPIWLSGVWLYHWQKSHSLPTTAARIGWAASAVLVVAYSYSAGEAQLREVAVAAWPFQHLPLGSAERFLSDYVVCAMVLANFIFARSARLDLLLRWARPIRLLSSYTFTLYLAHGMLIGACLTFLQPTGSPVEILLVTIGIAGLTWSIGQVTEKRKHVFQAAFERSAALLARRRGAGAKAPHGELDDEFPLARATERR